MSRKLINRRHFLTLPLAAAAGAALTPLARAFALAETRQGAYVVDVGILYGLLNFHLDGTLAEQVGPPPAASPSPWGAGGPRPPSPRPPRTYTATTRGARRSTTATGRGGRART